MQRITENLWERLFNRLPENAANEAMRILKQGGSFKDVDFLTLKQVEAEVVRYRAQAKAAIGEYRRWKTQKTVKLMFGVFHSREGAHLRAHAKDMASLYLDARRDHGDLTDLLMRSVSNDADELDAFNHGGRDD